MGELTEARTRRALRVEADHADGQRCDECRGGGRCGTLVLWWADILMLRAARELAEVRSLSGAGDHDGQTA